MGVSGVDDYIEEDGIPDFGQVCCDSCLLGWAEFCLFFEICKLCNGVTIVAKLPQNGVVKIPTDFFLTYKTQLNYQVLKY